MNNGFVQARKIWLRIQGQCVGGKIMSIHSICIAKVLCWCLHNLRSG